MIDLRSAEEAGVRHPLADVASVQHLPLGAGLSPQRLATTSAEALTLTAAYRLLAADALPRLARITGLVANAPGPLLVHCAAGKDRTGIVIGTVLAALDVPREQILADYLRTLDNLDALWARLRAAGIPDPAHDALLGVDAAALEAVLDELADHPAGVPGRLLQAGADPADLRRLAERLLVPDELG